MTKGKKNFLVALIGSILLSICVTINYFLQDYIPKWISIAIYVCLSILFLVHIVGIIVNIPQVYKMTTVMYIIAMVFMLIFGAIFWSNIYLEFYDENGNISAESVATVIGSKQGSKWIFILLAFLQVTFVPISSSIVTMAGVILFGAGEGFIYSLIGQLLGSLLAFYLGRWFGERFVIWIVGKDAFNKYRELIKGRDKIMLFFMFLFPFFPDDFLCMFAGLTTFTGVSFTIMIIFTRGLAVGVATLGIELVGEVLKLGIWAYVIFALALIIVIALFVLVWKKGDKLEYKMLSFISKILPKKMRKVFVSDEAIDAFSDYKDANETEKIENTDDNNSIPTNEDISSLENKQHKDVDATDNSEKQNNI